MLVLINRCNSYFVSPPRCLFASRINLKVDQLLTRSCFMLVLSWCNPDFGAYHKYQDVRTLESRSKWFLSSWWWLQHLMTMINSRFSWQLTVSPACYLPLQQQTSPRISEYVVSFIKSFRINVGNYQSVSILLCNESFRMTCFRWILLYLLDDSSVWRRGHSYLSWGLVKKKGGRFKVGCKEKNRRGLWLLSLFCNRVLPQSL